MIHYEDILIDDQVVTVSYSHTPPERCRPNKFDPGCREIFELHGAWIENVHMIHLDIELNKDLILSLLKEKLKENKAA